MCYEFIYSCQTSLQNTLTAAFAPGTYCLVSIGELHYLYCTDRKALGAVKASLGQEATRLFSLPADEMISVIDFPGMGSFQRYCGSIDLLEKLRQKNDYVLA
ncbi:MAG: hypothetical protein QM726_21245 [Chitinophagaceae bacterium]